MSITYNNSYYQNKLSSNNELVPCCTLPSHDIVKFFRILLPHYCHRIYSHWTILIVTLLSHDTLRCIRLSIYCHMTYIVLYSTVTLLSHTYVVPYSTVTLLSYDILYIVQYSSVLLLSHCAVLDCHVTVT